MNWFKDKEVPEYITDRVFMYYIIRNDGIFIPEYEDDGKETIFTDIDKKKVSTLGLIGRGVDFHFDTNDGIFVDQMGYKYSLYLPTNNMHIKSATRIPDLYNGEPYNDIIQYKGFISDDLSMADSNGNIQIYTNSYNIGWKRTVTDGDTTIHIKMILSIVLGEGIKITTTLSSNTLFEGSACIIRDDGLPCVSHNCNEKKSVTFDYIIS